MGGKLVGCGEGGNEISTPGEGRACKAVSRVGQPSQGGEERRMGKVGEGVRTAGGKLKEDAEEGWAQL